jgi:integrase
MPRPKRAPRKRQFTELFVRKAKPEKSAYLVWDTKQHGLALQVQPTGARAWKVIYSRHGRARWLHLGSAGAIALGDARTLAAEAMLQVARGRDPQAERKAERGAGTFAELAHRYLEEHAKKVNKSWPQAHALITRYVLPHWAKLAATTITRGDVKAMLARIDAPVLANQVLAATSAIFTWAVREELAPANPSKLVPRNKVSSRERVLAESELPRFWEQFSKAGTQGAALKAILTLGQRPGEVANMRVEHIKDGWWEMPGELIPGIWPGTKNSQSHRVWLPAAVRDLIGNAAGAGFVFAGSHGRPIGGLDGVMREISRKLEIAEAVRPHDLRRTHGSTITRLGFGRDAMNRAQNHKEGGIADVYDRHRYEDENKRIMEAVAAEIVRLAEGKSADKVVPLRTGGTR